jgi:Rhs element Vgr protein
VTAPSPTQLAGALVSVAISANGKALNSTYQVISIDIWTGVNKLPRARLVISDGSPNAATFPISETSALIPGALLTVALGYDGGQTQVFSGLVVQQGIEVSRAGPSRLIVDAADQATVMTLARKNAIFEKTTDSKVIEKLIGQAGLTAHVKATSETLPAVVQFYCSDWDLMLVRAQLNGMVVTTSAGAVTVAPPDTGAKPVLTLTYGQSILDFRAEMDATTQYTAGAIQSYAWDPATQALAASGQASTNVTSPGNLSSDELAKVFNVARYVQQTGGTLDPAELTAWSSAELLKTRLAKIRGEVQFQGSALAVVGVMVTLAGLGDRFNGAAYVSGVHHRVAHGLWTTSATIGLSPQWFSATAPQMVAPGASGQLPAAANLQTGLVLKTDQDPDGEFRVQVSLPLLQAASGLGLWARLGSFYASNSFGAEFYPEVGDEVVVAFMNGDPRFPIILGAVYSKKNPPPVAPDKENSQKTIVTRAGMRIDFFDKDQAIEISTKKKHSIRLDDKDGKLIIKDSNGNTVTLADGGITVDSVGKIALTAKGDISLAATGKLSLQGQGGVDIAGPTISVKASGSLVAEGSGNAKLSSGGLLTVQGSIVKIN